MSAIPPGRGGKLPLQVLYPKAVQGFTALKQLWFPLPSFCAHLRTHRYNTALQLPLSWMKLRAGASKTSYVRQERSSRAAEPRFAGSAQFSPWVLASWCWLLTHCSPRKGAESPREGIFPRGSNFLFHFSCSHCCTQGVCQHVLCKPVAVSLTGRHLNEEPLSKRYLPPHVLLPAALPALFQPDIAWQGGVPRVGFQQDTKHHRLSLSWRPSGGEGLLEAQLHPEQTGPGGNNSHPTGTFLSGVPLWR